LPHGMLVWQGDGNVYDKQFAFYASQREQPPATAPQPYAQWTHLWGSAGDRRHLLLDPPSRGLDWSDLQLERLALPESFRLKIKGTLPGADLEQLGIVKKPKKK
jgi:hypothetical protein